MKSIACIIAALLFSCTIMANNITITNVVASPGQVTFNISWDNSWNSTNNVDLNYPNNWDAAWVFVKVQSNTTNLWYHQNLAASGHSITPGSDGAALTIETQSDQVGVFIRRTNAGFGNIQNASVTLKLASPPPGTLFNVKVFGIEMVHIPQGDFYLGDGVASTPTIPRFNSVTVDANAQNTNGFASGDLYTGSPALPTSFPMGYNAFYAMKYEATNEQIADFYNTLTYDQQDFYFTNAPNAAAGTRVKNSPGVGFTVQDFLKIQTPGVNNTTPAVIGCDKNDNGTFNEAADGLTVAAGLLRWDEILAYLDWSGLRPMTEMEFEKICRGTKYDGTPNDRVADEYPWGTTAFSNYIYGQAGIVDANQPTMRYTGAVVNGRVHAQQVGNAAGTTNLQPFRVGMFAEGATGRAAAAAGFYGNMNLGDNVMEFVVGVGANATGYTAQPGDGILDNDGLMNQSGWPAIGTANAYGQRGGYYYGPYNNSGGTNTEGFQVAKTSNRRYAVSTSTNHATPNAGTGIRGVR